MKRSLWIIAALLLISACFAVWHLTTRTEVARGELLIRQGEAEVRLCLTDLDLSRVQGEVVDGKGDTHAVDAQGLSVADVVRAAGLDVNALTQLTVTAGDAYSAVLSGDEVRQPETAWLILQDDGARLIVFGDPDSRRNVSDVAILEAE